MYALVEIKGKQYKAEKGVLLRIDRIENAEGDILEFDRVMLLGGGDAVKVGTPYLSGARIRTKVEKHGRDRRVIVFKYKRRKDYRRTHGHRQQYSYVRVEEIIEA